MATVLSMAVAIGFATPGEALHQGGPQAVGQDFELGEQELFAPAQGQSGFTGGVMNPSHIYGKDRKTTGAVNQKENDPEMRKC